MGLVSDGWQFTTPIKPKYALRRRALLAGIKDSVALALRLPKIKFDIIKPQILAHFSRNRERAK